MVSPLISVVTPTFNRDYVLPAAIRSILAQTYSNIELIVVDDGSTDKTAEAIAAIIAEQDRLSRPRPTLRYVAQQNMGQSAARNRGIALARGDWICFLDSDDIWLPDKVQSQLQAIERCGATIGACCTDARLVDRTGLNTTAFTKAEMRFEDEVGEMPTLLRRLASGFGGVWIQTVMVRRDLVEQIGGFDPDLHFAEDHDFLFRLSLITRFAYVNRPLAVIERTTRALDPDAPPRRWDSVEFRLRAEQQRLEKWLQLSSLYPEDIRKMLLRKLRGIHSSWTNWHLEHHDFDQARVAADRALQYQFTLQLAIKWILVKTIPDLARWVAPRSEKIL